MVGGELAFSLPALQSRDQTNKEATRDQIPSTPPPPPPQIICFLYQLKSQTDSQPPCGLLFPSAHWPRLTSAASTSSMLLLGLLSGEASLKLPSESGIPSSKVKVPSSCPAEDLFYGEKNKTLKDLETNLPSGQMSRDICRVGNQHSLLRSLSEQSDWLECHKAGTEGDFWGYSLIKAELHPPMAGRRPTGNSCQRSQTIHSLLHSLPLAPDSASPASFGPSVSEDKDKRASGFPATQLPLPRGKRAALAWLPSSSSFSSQPSS